MIQDTAIRLKERLKPFCNRIEIAGSIRRGKQYPKDIEIVCIPDRYHLEQFMINMKHQGKLIFKKFGGKYKCFQYEGYNVDLFITDQYHWGLILMLRTGSKEFNIRLVNQLHKRNIKMEGGRLLAADGTEMICKEELDVFKIIDSKFIDPVCR